MKFRSTPSLKAPASRFGSAKIALIFGTGLTSFLSGPQTHAAPKAWNGSANGNWFNGLNWTPGGAPASGDTLTFAGEANTATIQNLADNFTVGGLAFTNSNATVTNAFSVAGTVISPATTPSKITLAGNITTTASTTVITDVLSIDIILSGTRTVTTGTGHNMTLSGTITQNGNSGLIKEGGGILTLSGSGNNTYLGMTTVNAGTVELNKSGATSAAIPNGGLTINTGGTVKYSATAGTTQIGNQAPVTVAGGTLDMNNIKDVIGKLIYNSGTISNVNGPLVLAAAGLDNLSMRDTTIDFAVTINSTGEGNLGVTFDATNNGTATINGGINISANGANDVNTAATVTRTFTVGNGTAATDMIVNGVISNTTSSGLIKSGAGTLVFTNNNSYSGATAVNSGTLLLNNTTGSGTGAGTVTVASGAALGGNGSVGGTAVFNDSSIFAWNLSVATPANTGSATAADTFAVTGNLTDADTIGGSVFKILLAGSQSFADNFWTANHSWNNVLTSGNAVALETLFTSFSYENATVGTISPTGYGSFSLSGSTLAWQAVPEPSTALAGLLLTAGLLRRRRK